MNSAFLEHLHSPRRPVIVFDGAMGTNLQVQNLTADDFGGPEYEGCNEYLVATKPEAVAKVHRGFLAAGADVIETDTFGGTSIVLAEYDLADRAYELNKTAAILAKAAAEDYSTPKSPASWLVPWGQAPSCPPWATSTSTPSKPPTWSRRGD
jgi:5-methyltetrahydrofolate--homocysteine methyltransferase